MLYGGQFAATTSLRFATYRITPPHPGGSPHPTSRDRSRRPLSQAHGRARAHVRAAATTVPPETGFPLRIRDLGTEKVSQVSRRTIVPGNGRKRGKGVCPRQPGDLRPQGRSFPCRGHGERSSCNRDRQRICHHGCRRNSRQGSRRPPARSPPSGRAHGRSVGPASRRS